MTDEKKPPTAVVTVAPDHFPARTTERLLEHLYSLDHAFGVATRAARACGENVLAKELEKRWDDYSDYISVPLSRVPAKLFE